MARLKFFLKFVLVSNLLICIWLLYFGGCRPIPLNLVPGEPIERISAPYPSVPVAGIIDGHFEVTNRGTAKYRIPIKTPPGRLGIEPKLSLEYDSGVKRGLAGFGWTLKGFSEIRRCGKNYAQDDELSSMKFNSGDNFELDGVRLIEVPGRFERNSKEYRTEKETFSRVVSYGNPITCFKVWTKDGKILTYGAKKISGENSIVWGRNRTARKWLLKTIEDRYGNSMVISYYNLRNTDAEITNYRDKETIEYFPTQISYTFINNRGGSAQRMVQFSYSLDTASARKGYQAGVRIKRGFLLSQIRSYITGEEGWQNAYFLQYEESPVSGMSRLKKITETDGKGNYLHPTEFVYSNSDLGWKGEISTNVPYPIEMGSYTFPIDVNGDGYDDILTQGYSGNYSRFRLSLNNGETADRPYDFPTAIDLNLRAYILGPLDYNLDGLMDIAYFEISESDYYEPTIKVRLSEGNDFGPVIDTGISTAIGALYPLEIDNITDPLKLKYIHLADLNGDRIQDLLICRKGYDDHPHWYYYLHDGTGFGSATRLELTNALEGRDAFEHKLLILDYNGDGAMDVLLGHRYSHPYFSAFLIATGEKVSNTKLPTLPFRVLQIDDPNAIITEEDVEPEEVNWYELPAYRVLDHNGDGLQDIILIANEEDTWHESQMWINTGNGFKKDEYRVFTYEYAPEHGKNRRATKIIDWNGDGRHDLLAPMAIQPCIRIHGTLAPLGDKQYQWYVLESVINGFKPVSTGLPCDYGMVDYVKPGAVRTLDVSGNLAPDILLEPRWKGFENVEGVFLLLKNKRNLSDLLVEIHDHPYGGHEPWKVKIEYSNPVAPVYSNQRLTPLPDDKVICYRPAYPLVASYKKDMGKGNDPAEYEYRYEDYRIDRFGRGELGFGKLTITDKVTRKVTIKRFDNYSLEEYGNGKHRYPYLGMVRHEKNMVDLGDGLIRVAETTNTFDVKRYDNGSRYYSYIKGVDFHEYEIDAGMEDITYWQEEFQIDDWGNHAYYKKKYSNVIYDERITTFSSNESQWLIGLPTRVVHKSKVGSEIKVRTIEHHYNPETGFLQFTEYEPDDPEKQYSKGFWRDRATGVVKKITENIRDQMRNTVIYYDEEKIFPVAVRNSENQQFDYQYNRYTGNIEMTSDPNDFTSTWEYDGFGREIKRTFPGIGTLSTGYTWSGQKYCVSRSLDGGAELFSFQDRLGRTEEEFWSTREAGVAWRSIQYNDQGLISAVSIPTFGSEIPNVKAIMTYDPMGRILTSVETNGAKYRYDYKGLHTRITDPRGGVTNIEYNNLGQISKVVDAENGSTSYEYGPFGNLSKIRDNEGNTTRTERDAYGHITLFDDPDGGISTAKYDGFGDLIERTDPNGDVRYFSYDMLGRIVEISGSDGITEYIYDNSENGIGSLSEAISPDNHRTKYIYDELGRLKTTIYKYKENTFYDEIHYDELGRIAGYCFPTKTGLAKYYVNYEYDDSGFLKKIIDRSGHIIWEAIRSNQLNQITEERLGNGFITKRKFDENTFLLESIRTMNADETQCVQDGIYSWDKMDNLIYRREKPLDYAEKIYYDKLSRVVEVHTSTDPHVKDEDVIKKLSVSYDHIGNIVNKTDVGHYIYSPDIPHAVIEAGSYNFQYDAKGNMTSCAAGDLVYKPFNKPATLSKGGHPIAKYYYDAFNNCVKKIFLSQDGEEKETVYYVNNVCEYICREDEKPIFRFAINAEGRIVAQVDFIGIIDRSTYSIQYMHLNHQGSLIARTDENGNLEKQHSYDAFGRETKLVWPFEPELNIEREYNYGYAGHANEDALQMIDMGGRIYNPVIARFITPDPFVQNQYNSQSLNRYSYVHNNPLTLIDPTGYQAKETLLDTWVEGYTIHELWEMEGGTIVEVQLDEHGNEVAWDFWDFENQRKTPIKSIYEKGGGEDPVNPIVATKSIPHQQYGIPENTNSIVSFDEPNSGYNSFVEYENKVGNIYRMEKDIYENFSGISSDKITKIDFQNGTFFSDPIEIVVGSPEAGSDEEGIDWVGTLKTANDIRIAIMVPLAAYQYGALPPAAIYGGLLTAPIAPPVVGWMPFLSYSGGILGAGYLGWKTGRWMDNNLIQPLLFPEEAATPAYMMRLNSFIESERKYYESMSKKP